MPIILGVTPQSICAGLIQGLSPNWSGCSGLARSLVRVVAIAGRVVSLSISLSKEISWKEELKEKCETKVSEYKQVDSRGQVLGSTW